MTAETFSTPDNNPLLRPMHHFQKGEWEAGLAALNDLEKASPLDAELRYLRQEMQLRARIDEDEKEDRELYKHKRLSNFLTRFVLVAAILFGTLFIFKASASWFARQAEQARTRVAAELQAVELSVKYRNAQELLRAGRVTAAGVYLDQIRAVDPEYPGLAELTAEIEKQNTFDARYAEALRLIGENNLSSALAILEEIAAQDPTYKDVSLQISNLQGQTMLGDLYDQAESNFQSGNWSEAAAMFESVRALDPSFRTEKVEERMFNSYVNAAEAVVAGQPDSLDALQTAENYFRKALAMRPQDQNIQDKRARARATVEERLVRSYMAAARSVMSENKDSLEALNTANQYFKMALAIRPTDAALLKESQMAGNYLMAQAEFSKGQWASVIDLLETVYAEDMEYAGGTSRQTLYEAYIARGDAEMVDGQYEAARADFKRASVIAEQTPNEVIRLFEAQRKVADVEGVLGNFEQGVMIFRAALQATAFRDKVEKNMPSLAGQIDEAEKWASRNNFRKAFTIYAATADNILTNYTVVTHTLGSGDYLTQLANEYHTTVQAILAANKVVDPKKLTPGQTLKIPVLP